MNLTALGKRIESVRMSEDLSMQRFGDRLGGVTATSVMRWEKGVTNITDRSINLICDKFDVNEDWLRTGEGEIFKPKNGQGSEIEEVTSLFEGLNAERKAVIINLLRMLNGGDIIGN